MSTPAKRTRLSAVYLTDTERDLLISGMLYLNGQLAPEECKYDSAPSKYARSFTSRRINDVVAILRGPDASVRAQPSQSHSAFGSPSRQESRPDDTQPAGSLPALQSKEKQ